jgi:phosphatidate cytidylyltransferase
MNLYGSKARCASSGVAGNLAGAGIGIPAMAPAIVPTFGVPFTIVLVPRVAGGSLWGDLLESAAKREAGIKDAGAWLPGFGFWISWVWGAG